jgi:putative membrane protein
MVVIPDIQEASEMEQFSAGNLLNAMIYSALGILIFVVAFVLVDKLTPYHLWNEIVHEHNTALAILIGAMSIGMCIIIAAAVH